MDPRFQGASRRFVSLSEDNVHQTSYKRYFIPTIEIKDYNVLTDIKSFFIS